MTSAPRGPALDDGEVLRTPLDKRRAGARFPGEGFRRRQRRNGIPEIVPGPGRALIWDAVEVVEFEPPGVWGAYPLGFAEWAMEALACRPAEVLHVCSGALGGADVAGIRVDIRAAAHPTVVADGRRLPFRDGAFAGVLIDPPYSVEYARELYDTDYPRPSHLLAEAARVTRLGGRIGFVHFLIPSPPKGTTILRRLGICQGCGYRIRALTVLQRDQAGLFGDLTEGDVTT